MDSLTQKQAPASMRHFPAADGAHQGRMYEQVRNEMISKKV